jgi:hypothetical protein
MLYSVCCHPKRGESIFPPQPRGSIEVSFVKLCYLQAIREQQNSIFFLTRKKGAEPVYDITRKY